MTERHIPGASSTGTPSPDARPAVRALGQRTTWLGGLALLGLGAALTVAAVVWSAGVLGFLALVTVFGGVSWIALGVIRGGYARLRRHPPGQ